MEVKINNIEDKIDKLDTRLDTIDKHLAVYNEQLTIHIKRSEALENNMKPIQDHVNQIKGAGKLLGIASLIASVIATLKSIFFK